MKRSIALCLVSLTLTGCTHTIKYWMDDGDRWTGPKIQKVLAVQPFEDQTVPITNKVDKVVTGYRTNSPAELRSPKSESHARAQGTNTMHPVPITETWRNNFRQGYGNKDVGAEVAAAMAKHLAHSGLFTRVVFGPDPEADYQLSGTLTEYSARALANHTAEAIQIGSGAFGLAGFGVALAGTSGMKTKVEAAVKIENLRLTDRNGESLWTASLESSTNFTAHYMAADALVVFKHADNALKGLVTDLIQQLGNSSLTNDASITGMK